jgi:[FeFe] hydrogenase H-cluster maturation GTPase HydF
MTMEKTPKSLRLAVGIFGRMNVGKSSFLNYLCGQDVAVTSAVAGTTTDIVEKAVELLPLGPVLLIDTAGIDDASALSERRLAKVAGIFERAEVFVCVTEAGAWTPWEERIEAEAKKRGRPLIIVVNKTDAHPPAADFTEKLRNRSPFVMTASSLDGSGREACVSRFTSFCASGLGARPAAGIPLLGDLLPAGGLALLVVPIDLAAPQGRLILPQVQAIRDALDSDAAAVVVKERELAALLGRLKVPPDLVVCDSQAVLKTVADTPRSVPCTTFSILFSRYKGDLIEQVKGLAAIETLKSGDKVLIAEACSHHSLADDIGRVKIPRWLRGYTGADLVIDVASGRDYPGNVRDYALVIHCGSCMLTRHETIGRIRHARDLGVPITNYGLCIAKVQGVIERVLSPFPAALDALHTGSTPPQSPSGDL